MDFKSRVEKYIGTISDTAALDTWLNNAVKYVSHLLPKALLHNFAKVVSSDSFSIANKILIDVSAASGIARRVPLSLSAVIADSNSIHYATSTSPAWYIADNGTIKSVPVAVNIYYYEYPSISNTDSSISNFPQVAEQSVILYASIEGLRSFIKDDTSAINTLSIPSVTAPSSPEVPVFTYTDATGTTLSSTSISVSSSVPSYIKPVSRTDFTSLTSYIETEEDLEKATTELGHQEALIKDFQFDLYNELNNFNAEAKIYDQELQKAIAQAQLTQERLMDDARRQDNIDLANKAKKLEKEIAEYTSKLSRFREEVVQYTQDVNKSIQEYATNLQRNVASLKYKFDLLHSLEQLFQSSIAIFRETP